MHSDVEELRLTPSEREVAREHWDAMMFAPSRTALESARLALMEASFPIQQAVIADINANWLREYEPEKEENPFLVSASYQGVTPEVDDYKSDAALLQPGEDFVIGPVATYSSSSFYRLPSHSLSAYAQRFIQSISHLPVPRLSERMASHNSSMQRLSGHH